MVFTYTDSDSFTALEEYSNLTDGTEVQPNILTQSMAKMSARNYIKPFVSNLRRRNIVINEPTEAIKINHAATIPSKCMHIMLDLGRTDSSSGLFIEDERVLCKIKVIFVILSNNFFFIKYI